MEDTVRYMPLEAGKLGQLLLMQSVLINLPDKKTIFSFVCRGLLDMPGVAEVNYSETIGNADGVVSGIVYLPVGVGNSRLGGIVLKISDEDLYASYSEYVKNFIFTVGVILEERYQRQLNIEHQELLGLRVEERTQQLQEEVKERKSVERVLRESEERYRLTMLAVNDGMFDFNIPLQKVDYSDRWFTMLGYEPDEFPHDYSAWKSLLHPDDCDTVEKITWDNINTKRRWQMEFRMKGKDGSWHWILSRGLCVEVGDDGKPVRVIGTHTDITSRKDAEDKLKEYKEHLEALVQDRTRDLEEKNTDLEHAMARIQEAQSQLILFEKMGALRHLVAGIAHEINNPLGAIESSREVFSESINGIIDSIPQLAEWLVGPQRELIVDLIDCSRKLKPLVTMLSTRDKRRIREQFEELFKANEITDCHVLARKMVEMHVFDDIEHFIPLLKEEGASEKLDVISEISDAFLACETIKTAVSKASKIVNALNSYIRKDTDSVSGESLRVNIDIRQSLENVLILFQNTIKNYIDLELSFEDDLPLIYGVSDELNQVWTNIIQNAILAMGGRGRLVIAVEKHPDGLVVNFVDEGCGMPKVVKDKMFEPLFTTRPAGEGLGLGMDIVWKIVVEKHAGNINVDSEVGKGTKISVFLPIGIK